MNILGTAQATAEQMASYLLKKNPSPKINIPVLDFCQLFLDVGAKEGVRGDGLFAQSCKETGNFKYGGTVKPEQNNYAGLGTTDPNTPGATFPDEATGILAQAQHAKAYTGEPLNMACVDPRYDLLISLGKAGTAKQWEELGGKWAVPGYDVKKYASLAAANVAKDSYGYQIVNILNDILKESKTGTKQEEKTMANKIIALDAGHYYNTPGKRCMKKIDPNTTREWYLNDRIMDRVQELLAPYNCKTIRVDDTTGKKNISLAARAKAANGANADIYISMHHNAGINGGSGGGTVVFWYSSASKRMDQAAKLYNAIVKRTGLVGNRSQKVIKKGYEILRTTSMPSLLVENGFMDSTHDTPIILTASHAEKTAQGVVEFLVNELKLQKTGTATTTTNTTTTTTVKKNPYTMPTYTLYRYRVGMKAEHVKWLQWELVQLGCNISIDGKFGPATQKALKEAQARLKLTADGKCGPATRGALLAAV